MPLSSSSSSSFSSSPYVDEEELASGCSISRARGVSSAGVMGCAKSKLWEDKEATRPLLCGAMVGLSTALASKEILLEIGRMYYKSR